MGINVGSGYHNISCDFCDNKTENYYGGQNVMWIIIEKKGWRKNYITETCTCPDCVKKQTENMNVINHIRVL